MQVQTRPGPLDALPAPSSRPQSRQVRHAVRCTAAAGTVTREVLSSFQRTKLDPRSDREFYGFPKLVTHVDGAFLRQVTQLYRQLIPRGGSVLDLMSSWVNALTLILHSIVGGHKVSHLPEDVQYSRIVGHGMNAEELRLNRRLDSFFVRDLNADPDGWALESQSFDAVLCCVSVQYLQQPERVFAEVFRVLKPGGVCIVAFSNRLYYSKAISAWRDNSGFGRVSLVKQYFLCVEGFTEPEALREVGGTSLPANPLKRFAEGLSKLLKQTQDPFYAVVSHRNFKRT